MKPVKIQEIAQELLNQYSPGRIGQMTPDDLIKRMTQIEEEIIESRIADQQDRQIYGDPNYDEYTMSDSHRADVQSEKWEWLKNEGS